MTQKIKTLTISFFSHIIRLINLIFELETKPRYSYHIKYINHTEAMNELRVTKKNVLERARVVWKRDPCKERSVGSEDKDFRHYFGCGLKVCLKVWNIMTEKDLHPDKPSLDHYLHSLLFIKIYPKRDQLCQLTSIKCYKQAKRGVFQYIMAVASVEDHVVCENILPSPSFIKINSNNCLDFVE